MNALDESAKQTDAKADKKSVKKKKRKEKAADGGDAAVKKSKVKPVLITAAIIIVLAAAAIFVLMNLPSEGEKVLKNVPIGRNLAYAEAKTETDFTKVSKYDAVNKLGDFDNICETPASSAVTPSGRSSAASCGSSSRESSVVL